jgi:hypothetical protein
MKIPLISRGLRPISKNSRSKNSRMSRIQSAELFPLEDDTIAGNP